MTATPARTAAFATVAFVLLLASAAMSGPVRIGAALVGTVCAIVAYSTRPGRADQGHALEIARTPIFRRAAQIVPPWASVFLIFMAILIDSPALFYMATAMVATIAACRLQAYLAVRGLRFERIAPPAVHVGQRATVMLTVWSERRIQRPLIQISDQLPSKMRAVDRTPSLPIAPSLDQPIATRYSFRPMRRGRYRWQWLVVTGTDALGLVSTTRAYKIEPAELVVYPARIPVSIALRPVGGEGGTVESEQGRAKGQGLEPGGVREYVPGDPIKTIHWKSTARTGQVMVKEFEVGSAIQAAFFLQLGQGTEVGHPVSTLEAMCGHLVYLSEQLLRAGAAVLFPGLEPPGFGSRHEVTRMGEILDLLTTVDASQATSIGQSLRQASVHSASIYILIAVEEEDLPAALSHISAEKVCLVYDAAKFGKLRPGQKSAQNGVYLDRLRAVGAEIRYMPHVEDFV